MRKPIIFSGESVRRIFAHEHPWKTQTRRVVVIPPGSEYDGHANSDGSVLCSTPTQSTGTTRLASPYAVGQELWVRETFAIATHDRARVTDLTTGVNCEVVYRADRWMIDPPSWISPIFMPRWASRYTVRVTAIKVERLQEISSADIRDEGIHIDPGPDNHAECVLLYRKTFREGWDRLNAKRGYSWTSNPIVRAFTFEVVR